MAQRHVGWYREAVVSPDHNFYVGSLSSVAATTVASRGYASVLTKPTKQGDSKLGWKEVGDLDRDVFLSPRRVRFELPDSLELDLRDFAVRKDRQLARYE